MNSKGQVMFYALMICVVVLVIAAGFAKPALTATNSARTQMDCSNSSIDSYKKGACLITDLTSPYFIGILICMAIVILGAKLAFSGESIA